MRLPDSVPARFRTALLALACTTPVVGPAAAQSEDPATWSQDVDFILAAFDTIHPAPNRKTSREAWKAAADELKARLPSLAYHEAVAELSRLVALAGDGHSRLGQVRLVDHRRIELEPLPGEAFQSEFPVRFEIFADGLHVVEADRRHAGLVGARVVSVHGRPTPEAIDLLRPYVSADNEAWLLYAAPRYLQSPAYLHAARVAPSLGAPLALRVEDESGRRFEVSVPALPIDAELEWIDAASPHGQEMPPPRYRRLTSNAFEYLEESRTVYVRYAEVRDGPGESIAEFAKRLFAFIDTAEVRRLVVDVRRNGGGDNYLNQPLVHGLIRAVKIDRPGRLFVITDRGTFSAAMSFVGEVERNLHALFVGEPTGSPINQYGDTRKLTLPRSGILVKISELYWQHADPRDPRFWVVPDLPAPLTFADYRAGRDPALEAILGYEYEPGTLPDRPNRNWRRPSQRREVGPLVHW